MSTAEQNRLRRARNRVWYTRKCPICNKEFVTYFSNKNFCSPVCRVKSKNKAYIVNLYGEEYYHNNVYIPWKLANDKRQEDPNYMKKRYELSYISKKKSYKQHPERKIRDIEQFHSGAKSHKQRWKEYSYEYELIENYDKAKADNFKGWHCHHRLELHQDGSIRFTKESLIKLDLYTNRPASELIFLTSKEHTKMHGKNRHA